MDFSAVIIRQLTTQAARISFFAACVAGGKGCTGMAAGPDCNDDKVCAEQPAKAANAKRPMTVDKICIFKSSFLWHRLNYPGGMRLRSDMLAAAQGGSWWWWVNLLISIFFIDGLVKSLLSALIFTPVKTGVQKSI
jgi:hypothetical protein